MKKILKFEADWCAGCKVLNEKLEKLNLPYEIETIDCNINYDRIRKHNVTLLPTLIIIEDGVETKKLEGNLPLEMLREWIG